MSHRNCVTDPLTKQYWREFQRIDKGLGLSFTEYVAQRVAAERPQTVTAAMPAPWYTAECGHQHPWGFACTVWSNT